jgi:Undecaprenyl-phosphate glucose phosphotransferase
MQQVTRLYGWVDAAAAAVFAGLLTHVVTQGGLLAATVGEILPLAVGFAILVWALGALGCYAFAQRETLPRHLLRVLAAFGLTGAPLLLGELLLPGGRNSLPLLAQWFGPVLAGLCLLHVVWWNTVRRWRRDGKLTPNIVIVGATVSARKLIETALKTREVAVLGVFDDRLGRAPKEIAGVPVLGDTGDLLGHKVLPYVDRIVIAVDPNAQTRVREIIARLRVLPNDVSLVLDSGGEDGRVRALSRIADAQLAQVSGEPADVRRAVVKRLQDITVGWTALILGLPVMALVALAIKLDSPGPIFFRQRRHGFNNEEILVWKFRSMRQEAADFAAVQQVQAGDDRVTRVGRFIRKTSLDELPQLLNVIGGEMSLVGPRPHAVGMKTGQTESARLVAEYAHRHRMKPGMTGWAAINGSRGPVDSPELVRRRVALDIEYIERQSFWFDVYIMTMTIPCLLGDSETVR